MDQLVRRVLRFESFELDLNRFCLRRNDHSFDLRPKTFAVCLRLAQTPGQLVSKDELYREVWPNVIVGDDSLSQCIHELRQALGDTHHQLIKTIQRRGYLLDARPLDASEMEPSSTPASGTPVPPAVALRRQRSHRIRWAITASLVLGALAGLATVTRGTWAPRFVDLVVAIGGPSEVRLPEADMKKLAALSAAKELPLPAFRILEPAADVPASARRFIGVWVSGETGWSKSSRQMMMLVTSVDQQGVVTGYLSNGPGKPHSHGPEQAFALRFRGHIVGGVLRDEDGAGVATLAADGRIRYERTFSDGIVGAIVLDPVWRLPQDFPALAAAAR